MKTLCLTSLGFILVANADAQHAEVPRLQLVESIPMQSVAGRIDHMAADVADRRLFVAALGNDSLEVIDLRAGKRIRNMPGFAEPQGVAFVAEFNRLFVANGRDGTCRVLDGTSLKTLSTVDCGEDADNVRYDAAAKRVYVGYGSGALAVLDARSGAKLANIELAGHPESFRFETAGRRIFVNVPSANHIAVVDREKGQVTVTWPLSEAKANFPLILDELNQRLFTGCRDPARLLVYDYAKPAGRLITDVPIAHDADDLFYDAPNHLLYVSCGQGILDVIRQDSPDHYEIIQRIPSATGARTSLFIPELKYLCLAVPRHGSQSAEIRVFRTP